MNLHAKIFLDMILIFSVNFNYSLSCMNTVSALVGVSILQSLIGGGIMWIHTSQVLTRAENDAYGGYNCGLFREGY